MSEVIEFVASIAQVRTMADGGIRITLDLPEDAIAEAAMLMQIRQAGEVVTVQAWPGEQTTRRNATHDRSKRRIQGDSQEPD